VAPFAVGATDRRDYWLVYPTARRLSAKIVAFRTWILAEARAAAASRSPLASQRRRSRLTS